MPVQTTKPSDYPQAVIQQIEKLAQNIVIARKRRKETQAQWAKRLGVSQPTMARIERGDPAVAMASYVMCMWLINPESTLSDLIAPQQDHIALEHEVTRAQAHRPKRRPASQTPKASRVPVSLVEEMRLFQDPTAKLVEEMRLAQDPLNKLREELKQAQTPTALGLAALIAKKPGNSS
jgi:DNA-binding XRE family transcriptional regulator